MLPGRYKRVQIKQQAGLRFEEFDFSYYNRTPFVGLENDLANAYTNALIQASAQRCLKVSAAGFSGCRPRAGCLALHARRESGYTTNTPPSPCPQCLPPAALQVLFFTPATRDALMQHVPDAAAELSLTCEMSFLFRMLVTASGTVCQVGRVGGVGWISTACTSSLQTAGCNQAGASSPASAVTCHGVGAVVSPPLQAANLLRALRQNKEAALLGLVEGVKGERAATDIEASAAALPGGVRGAVRCCNSALHK